MEKDKVDKSIEELRYIGSAAKVDRWILCQKIGKVFYYSKISSGRLREIMIYLDSSDALEEMKLEE